MGSCQRDRRWTGGVHEGAHDTVKHLRGVHGTRPPPQDAGYVAGIGSVAAPMRPLHSPHDLDVVAPDCPHPASAAKSRAARGQGCQICWSSIERGVKAR